MFLLVLALASIPSLPLGIQSKDQPSAAAPRAADRVQALRERCEGFLAAEHVVGMGVAVLRKGELVFESAFGQSDREAARPARESTLYRLASVSKPVTATLAMQLVEQGKLELDVGVAKYVPGLEPALGAVTLRQILSHTSGIRHYRLGRVDNGVEHRTTEQALSLFVEDPLLFQPGEKYSYSTHAFTLAAAAVERAAAKDLGALMAERIGPGAPRLCLEVLALEKPERAALYRRNGADVQRSEPREDLSWKYGGGGMESTARDLARFADLVLRAELVSVASREAMWTRSRTNDGKEVEYGLGWAVGEKGKLVQHSGSQQGASASLSILRESGLVVVVLTNTEGGNAPELGQGLRQILTAP